MRLAQLLSVLREKPLAITPSAHASYLKLFEDHLSQSRAEFNAEREGTDWCGGDADIPQAETREGIAYIPILGPIGKGLSKFEIGAGCADCADIIQEINDAEADDACRAIIMVFDSPGGMVTGLEAVAKKITACEKPIHAFSDGMICSAAYWLACACDGIWATSDADIGSIGVYCYSVDSAKRYEMAGLKPVVVTSGVYKAMNAPGTSLSKAQLELLQSEIDDIALAFYEHVEATRGADNVSRLDMRGQSFTGKKASQNGLIDGLVDGIEDVAAML